MNVRSLADFSHREKIIILIAAATAVRLFFAQTGLGIDETYTVATSRSFHLSTFDHPPMAWWLAWFAQSVFHSDSPFLVRLPFIFLSGVATWQTDRLTRLLFSAPAGLFAALAFTCAPVLGITDGTWVLPDGPLIVGLLASAICLARLSFIEQEKGWLWLAAGFWGGVALLSKYHGIFLFLGAALFVLTNKNMRHWLLSPWPYLGSIIGLAVFSPVLIWNFDNGWISFAFQGGRASSSHLHLLRPLETLLGQSLFLTPWLWAGLVWVAVKAARLGTGDCKRWFLLCLAIRKLPSS